MLVKKRNQLKLQAAKKRGEAPKQRRQLLPQIGPKRKRGNSAIPGAIPNPPERPKSIKSGVKGRSLVPYQGSYSTPVSPAKSLSSSYDEDEFPIASGLDMEKLLYTESIMESIVQKTATLGNVTKLWYTYHTFSKELDLGKIDEFFRDEPTRKMVRISLILEWVTLALLNLRLNSPASTMNAVAVGSAIRSLAQTVYQNFISIVLNLTDKIPQKLMTPQSKKLKEIAVQKQKLAKFSSSIGNLSYNNDQIIKKIATLSKPILNTKGVQRQQKGLYSVIFTVTRTPDRFSLDQVRNMLAPAFDPKVVKNASNPRAIRSAVSALLPEKDEKQPYTLVLDLDETLVHYVEDENSQHLLVRPYWREFLKAVSELYEVVIFTAALQDYADWAIDSIDSEGWVSHRLYRKHASKHGNAFVKDLSRIGRNLSKVIIVDNVAENFQLQPDNGIFIKSWFDDAEDTALVELLPLIKGIVDCQVDDVREALRVYRNEMVRRLELGNTTPHINLDLASLL